MECRLELKEYTKIPDRRLILLLWTVVTLAMEHRPMKAQGQFWVTAYYPAWAEVNLKQGGMPIWDANLNGITHIVRFMGWTSKTAPYVRPMVSPRDSIEFEFHGVSNPGGGPTSWTNWQDSLISVAHRKDIKVVLSSGNNKGELDYISSDSLRTEICAKTLIEYCVRKGYDGVEVDWEPPSNTFDCSRLLRRLRFYLDMMTPRGILMIAPGNGKNYATLFNASLCNEICDQINIQLYGYAPVWWSKQTLPPGPNANVTWYTSPLHRGNLIPLSEAAAWDTWGPNQWASEYGFSKSKLGAGMPFYGWNYRKHMELGEPVTTPSEGYVDHYSYIAKLIANGGAKYWDNVSKVPYLKGTAIKSLGPTWHGAWGVLEGETFWTSFEDSQSVAEKTKWARANDLGGIMIYDMFMDFDAGLPAGKKQPLLNSVVDALTAPLVEVTRIGNDVPKAFLLDQDLPNQKTTKTSISYSLPQRGHVRISIFTSAGQTLAVLVDESQDSGNYRITFDTNVLDEKLSGAAKGVHFCRLETDKYSVTKKFLLLR